MNEVKLSTSVTPKRSSLNININMEAVGLDWQLGDIVRVKSYKKEGRIILKLVGKKVSKTVCHTLKSTGGNAKTHNMGFRINFTKNRFKAPLAQVLSVPAAVRFTNKKNNELEVFLPRDVFEQ